MWRACFGPLGFCLLVGSFFAFQTSAVRGASGYADPLFQQQWQQGEALTPNFWGPLSTAKDGQQEAYQDVPGGMRLVQYFDKGRMELRNGVVTNGLLASEIVRGKVQVGDAAFLAKDPPAIPIAGDSDNAGPTYAHLSTSAKALLAPTPAQPGGTSAATVGADGTLTPGASELAGDVALKAYDSPTQHNVPGVFDAYRNQAGLGTIGYAISEPFGAVVKVGGVQKGVLIQVFERRMLTFTATNDPAFQVEMGNIGQHYYQWRYTGAPMGSASLPPTSLPPTSPASPSASASAPSGQSSLPYASRGGSQQPLPFATVPHMAPNVPNNIPSPDGGLYVPPTNLTCATFHSQAAAQTFLRAFPNDPSHLDPNKTGIACPNNPAPKDTNPVART